MSSASIIGSNVDADAFMRKYLSQPTDVIARLVFADWLEETSESHNIAWAYYIRLKAEADQYSIDSYQRRELERQAVEYTSKIRANLTIPAKLFINYPKSLLQLLPPANITVRLMDLETPIETLSCLPESIARENLLLPLDAQNFALLVASVDPHNHETAQKLEFILNRTIIMVGAKEEEIQSLIDQMYGQSETISVDSVTYEFPEYQPTYPLSNSAPEPNASDAPIVRLLALIFQEANNIGADRILIFPDLDSVAVRFRIDDTWIERDRPPLRLLQPMTRHLAMMTGIPIEWTFTNSSSLTPFTGEIPFQIDGTIVQFRITIQPSPDGPITQIDLIH